MVISPSGKLGGCCVAAEIKMRERTIDGKKIDILDFDVLQVNKSSCVNKLLR